MLLAGIFLSAVGAESIEEEIRLAEESVLKVEERRDRADTLARLGTRLERLMEEEEGLHQELESIRDELEDLRATKRAAAVASRREAAVGSSVELLETSGGNYRDATILEVSDIGLHIRHASGAGRVGFDELSEELQEKYGYDPELARRKLEEEEEQQRLLAESMGMDSGEEGKGSAVGSAGPGGGGGSAAGAPAVRPEGRLTCRVIGSGNKRTIEVSAVANCPAKIMVWPTPNERGSRIIRVPQGERVTRVVRLRRNKLYYVTLKAESGELLGRESSS